MKVVRFNESDTPEQRTAKLNELSRAVTVPLDSGLTVTQHLAAFWREVTFDGPVSSLSIAIPSTSEPHGVLLVYLRKVDTNEAVALASTFAWTFSGETGRGEISTTSFSGVSSGQYRARLLVIRE